MFDGSEDEAETCGKHSQEDLSFTSTLTLEIKPSTHSYKHTHTSDPVQKNIYRQCTRGYIYIYIFHLDYLQERKGSPFGGNRKIETSLLCEALIWMQNPCVVEPEHQSAHGHVPKQTFLSDMHVPLKHTHGHTHLHGQQTHIHT